MDISLAADKSFVLALKHKNRSLFLYFSSQHMLIITRQAICYVFTLTDAERAQVHTDAGLRQLEVTIAIYVRAVKEPV